MYDDFDLDDIELEREPSITYWRRRQVGTRLPKRIAAAIVAIALAFMVGEGADAHGDRVQVPDPPGTEGGPVIHDTDGPTCWVVCPTYGEVAPAEPPAEAAPVLEPRGPFEAPGFPVDEHGNPIPQLGTVTPGTNGREP